MPTQMRLTYRGGGQHKNTKQNVLEKNSTKEHSTQTTSQNPQTTSQDSTQNPISTNQSDYQATSTQDMQDMQSPPPIKNKKDKQHKKSYKEIKHESKYDDLQAKQLDRVVVTAGGYEQDIKNAPASVSIIPKE